MRGREERTVRTVFEEGREREREGLWSKEGLRK